VGVNGPLAVVVVLPRQSSSATQSLLSSMSSGVAATSGVASVGPAAVNSSADTAVFNVIPTTRPQSGATTALVNRLRDDVLPKQHVTTFVTGTTAGNVDFTRQVTSRMVWLILGVVAISFILLTVAFRSVTIAIKAAVLNLLSIGAAYGVIVAIFEWGWAHHCRHPHDPADPVLRADAGVRHRVRPVHGLRGVPAVTDPRGVIITRDPHRAVAIGIGSTARVITTAASIMIVVFASFVLNTDPTVKMLAVGMAFAVLIDASLVRMILVPSIMTLLGRHAWWLPRWLEPVVPHLTLEGSTAAASAGVPEDAARG
jgi:RND superfamily putative drug exporter